MEHYSDYLFDKKHNEAEFVSVSRDNFAGGKKEAVDCSEVEADKIRRTISAVPVCRVFTPTTQNSTLGRYIALPQRINSKHSWKNIICRTQTVLMLSKKSSHIENNL